LYGLVPAGDGGRVSVGTGVSNDASFGGSNNRRLDVSAEYQWANGLSVGTNGLTFAIERNPQFQYGVGLGYDMGRKADGGSLVGMGDVPGHLIVGGFFNYGLTRDFNLTSALRVGSGEGGKGAVLDLGAVYRMQLAPQWRLGFGVTTVWANRDYMQSFYGVTDAQSASSGNATYAPGAGFREVGANAALTYQINRELSATFAMTATSLVGDARNSPLVRNADSATGQIGLSYRF
jgi:outer membrane scaffolding protein for murein synthesis (MipA/OmpV family)